MRSRHCERRGGVLRGIHDSERGAGMIEYAAVILLVAAIANVVLNAGIPGRVAGLVEDAVSEVAGAEPDGADPSGEGGAPTAPADGSSDYAAGSPYLPEDAPNYDTGEGLDDTAYGFQRTVDETGQDPTDDDLHLAPGEDAHPDDLDLGPVGDVLGALGRAISDDVTGGLTGIRELITNPAEAVGGMIEGLVEDPLGLLLSEELRDAWQRGDWAEVIGYGLWEIGTLFVPGPGWIAKAFQTLFKATGKVPGPSGGSDSPQGGSDSDNGSGQRDENDQKNEDEENRNNAGCAGNSFVPGTPVLLADGSTAPIEDIGVGDEVWAFNPVTGREGPREVTHLHNSGGGKTLVDLTITDTATGATGTLTATDAHPFWAPETGAWVRAIDLTPGTWLRTSAGTWSQVTATETRTLPDQHVHNLTVNDLHTYYVGTGGADALVHNDGPCPEAESIADHANDRFNEGALDHHVDGVPPERLADYVDNVLNEDLPNLEVRYGLRGGRTAYWDNDTGAVVIEDPGAPHGGTVFTPSEGRTYFEELE